MTAVDMPTNDSKGRCTMDHAERLARIADRFDAASSKERGRLARQARKSVYRERRAQVAAIVDTEIVALAAALGESLKSDYMLRKRADAEAKHAAVIAGKVTIPIWAEL